MPFKQQNPPAGCEPFIVFSAALKGLLTHTGTADRDLQV